LVDHSIDDDDKTVDNINHNNNTNIRAAITNFMTVNNDINDTLTHHKIIQHAAIGEVSKLPAQTQYNLIRSQVEREYGSEIELGTQIQLELSAKLLENSKKKIN